jgi:subtilase family serine protease
VRHPEVASQQLSEVKSDEDVVVAVSLSPKDLPGLKAYAEAVNDPHSQYYHQFLTPEQIGAKFGPSDADVATTISFLKSHGVQITDVAKNKLVIMAEGTAASVTEAFQTHMAYATREDGTKFRTNTSELHMPASLINRVVSVDGIDTSMLHKFAGHKFTGVKKAQTDLTSSQNFNAAMYRGQYSNSGYQYGFYGQGVNIAIANWDGYRLANIPYWTSANNLPVPAGGAGSNIHVVKVGTGTTTYGQGSPGGEGDLDLQAVLMAAPLANIYDYDDTTTDTADPLSTYSKISSDNIADVVSESYGWLTSSTNRQGTATTYSGALFTSCYNMHLSLTAQGITYLAATGDSGTANFGAPGVKSSKCFGYPDIDPNIMMIGGTVPTVDTVTNQRVGEADWGLATNSGGTAGGTGGFDPYDTPAHGFAFNVAPPYQTTYLPTQTASNNLRLMPDWSSIAAGQNGLGDETAPDNGWAMVIFYSSGTTYPLGSEVFIDGTSIASPATAGSIGEVMSQVYAGVTPNPSRSNVRLGSLQNFLYQHGNDANLVYDVTAGITVGNLPGTTTPTPPTIGWDYATGWGAPIFSGFINYTAAETHVSVLHPNSAAAGTASVALTLTGVSFNSNEIVTFNGTPLATTFVSSTELTATIPGTLLAAGGANAVGVSAPIGPGSATRTFSVENPVPSTLGTSPTSVMVDAPSFPLTVTGTGFVNGSTVKWSGKGLPTTFVNSTTLTATVGTQFLQEPGTATITVTNPEPGGGTSANSASVALTVNPVPNAIALSQTTADLGGYAFTLSIYGANFVPASVVKWNGTSLPTTYLNAFEVQAAVGTQYLHDAGNISVTVTNPKPGGGVSSALLIDVEGYPLPTETSLSPNTAFLGGAGFTLTVNGTGFINTSTVKWAGTSLPTTFVSATQLTATVGSQFLAVAGTPSITVTNSKPGGGTSNGLSVTVAGNPVPAITTLSPSTASYNGPTYNLTVNGTGFISGSTVKWNGTSLPTTYVSATQVTASVNASFLKFIQTATITVTNGKPAGGTSGNASLPIN